MSCFVVDASVAIKWFVPEIHSPAALRLLSSAHELIAPDLFWPEIGNALSKKIKRKEVPIRAAQQIIQQFSASPLRIYPSAPMLELALTLSVAEQRSIYDSLYLALALIKECPLVTADEKLLNALRHSTLAKRVLWVGA